MNSVFTAKLLQNLRNKKANKGFTLIELLVVVIIIGVLAAVALPNLLSQVGKARESEAKTGIGSINRAQQAFHFERRTFAPVDTDVEQADNALGVVINPDYYAFDTDAGADGIVTSALVTATDENADSNGTRNYAGAIAFSAGAYDTSVCQSDTVGGDATATATGGVAGCDAGTNLEAGAAGEGEGEGEGGGDAT